MNLILIDPSEIEPDGTVVFKGRRRDHVREVLRSAEGDRLRVGVRNGPQGSAEVVLADDRRVVLLERTNARKLTREQVPEPIERMVGDLSFISWAAVLPAVVPLLGPEARLLLLVKPQFELAARGRDDLVAGGVVRDAAAVEDCLTGLYNTWQAHALAPRAVVPAGVRGAKGNQEYFVLLERGETTIEAEYQAIVRQALAEVTE